MRPRLLDLFAGGQGAGVGYARAGFEVHAVDIEEHEKHPEIASFAVADAMDVLADEDYCRTFDVIHASPPCQALTTMSGRYRGKGGPTDDHVNLIPPVQAALRRIGVPYVLENVPGAAPWLRSPVLLHGGMFGLCVYRPRLFESDRLLMSWTADAPGNPIGVYGKCHDGRRLWTRADGTIQRAAASLAEGQEAMGIDWMEWHDLTEAIPPAYTRFLGEQLISALEVAP